MRHYFSIFLFIIAIQFIGFGQTTKISNPVFTDLNFHRTQQFYETGFIDNKEQLLIDQRKQEIELEKVHRFGKEFSVNIDFMSQAEQSLSAKGTALFQFGIRCKSATSINLVFSQFQLSPNAFLYVLDNHSTGFIGAYTALNNTNYQALGTEVIETDEVIVLLEVPVNEIQQNKLKINTIVHGYKSLKSIEKSLNTSGDCEIDVNCPLGLGWENERNSSVLIIIGGQYCSGSLVNNTSNDLTPYILSAYHCGLTPGTWVYRFRYESPANLVDCGTSALSGTPITNYSINGGVLKAKNKNSDVTLTLLNTKPDTAWNIYYSGWDRTGLDPQMNTCIHHPDGDITKISVDTTASFGATWQGTPVESHWHVPNWDFGATEGGSSGSPLYNEHHRIVGQLHGGVSNCGNALSDMWDEFGKFSLSWDGHNQFIDTFKYNLTKTYSAVPDSMKLMSFLDPLHYNSAYINGYDPKKIVPSLEVSILGLVGLQPISCDSLIQPKFILGNHGLTAVHTVTFKYGIDGIDTNIFTWNGAMVLNETRVIRLPNQYLSSGKHTFRIAIQAINGVGLDLDTTNNQILASSNYIKDGEKDTLWLYLDQYGSETSWQLSDSNQTVLYRGGPYEDLSTCVVTLKKIPFCLSYLNCYTFKIFDTSNDGLSTVGCNGSLFLERPDSSKQFQIDEANSNFGGNTSFQFCLLHNLGINEVNELLQFELYPNPAQNQVHLHVNQTGLMGATQLEVISSDGKQILSSPFSTSNFEFSVEKFERGIYLVKLANSKGITVKKLIVHD